MKNEETCCFCGAMATKQCDFPMGYPRFVGHTPKQLVIRNSEGEDISGDILISCSRPICDECAFTWNEELDFCPWCVQRFEEKLQCRKISKHNQELEKKKLQQAWRKRKK